MILKDRALAGCIYGLAEDIKPPSVDWLKAQAHELQEKYPMQYLITRQLVDEQEQMTDKLPALQ